MRKFLVSVLFLSSFSAFGQMTEAEVKNLASQGSEQELLVNSSRMLQENFYYYAELLTNRLLELKPENVNYLYRRGYIYLEKDRNHAEAIKYLTKATAKIDKNYDMYSTTEDAAPADVYFHLGHAYHLDENLDKAVENYKKFLELTNKNSSLIPEAKKKIAQCKVAKELMANPVAEKPVNMGDKLNTSFPDYSVTVSLDGKVLYYTSQRPWEDKSSEGFREPMLNNYPEDVYISKLDLVNGQWTTSTRSPFSRPQTNESTLSVSIDERRIYTYNDKKALGDVYYSDFRDGKFGNSLPVETKGVNTDRWEPHYTVSPDGNMIFFVSDRLGGFGRRDIYFMERVNGSWTEPKNIGGNINTVSDEDGPFVGLDNNILYFSSNDSTSMGEFDIFMTVRDENGIWSKPKNLGYPLNSVGDDIFFSHNADGSMAYFASFRKGGLGKLDLYGVPLKEKRQKNVGFLSGVIMNKSGNSVPESSYTTLKCLNCQDQSENIISPRMNDGGFFSKLEKCREYELTYYYSASDPNPYKEKFSTNCDLEFQEINRRVILDDEQKRIFPPFNYTLMVNVVSKKDPSEKIADASLDITSGGKKVSSLISDASGNFNTSNLLKGKAYGDKVEFDFVSTKDSYIKDAKKLNVTLGMDSIIKVTMELVKDEKGELVYIIYYNFDKSNIRPNDATDTLDKVVAILNANPKLKVELGSHTDTRGTDAYNIALSERRAKEATKYIAARISNPKRITYKGYGETVLTNDCVNDCTHCTDAMHEKNRRTEIRIK